MTLGEWADIAQIVIALAVAAGVISSLIIATSTLKEVQQDRRQRQAPHLMLEVGAWIVPVEFVKRGPAVPGVAMQHATEAFLHQGPDAESVAIKRSDSGSVRWGHLHNLGTGPATDVRVVWIAETVEIGGETFAINETKLKEPPYQPSFNSMPSTPSAIPAGQEGKLTRLPTFIVKDIGRKISLVTGRLELSCTDVFGTPHSSTQSFRITTMYDHEDLPHLIVTFSYEPSPEEV